MSPSRTLVPFDKWMLEPFGWLGSFQRRLGYASLPLRLRSALKRLQHENRSNNFIVHYVDYSPIWQRFFWDEFIDGDPSPKQKAMQHERLQELEIWLSQNLSTLNNLVTVSIQPSANPPISKDLPFLNKKNSLTVALLKTLVRNSEKNIFSRFTSLQNWLHIAANGLDCEIIADEHNIPPAGKYHLRFIEPELGEEWQLGDSKIELGWQVFESKGWSNKPKIAWASTFPLLGKHHATLYWAGNRFWLQCQSLNILYTYSGEQWEWLGPFEARPLPKDKDEDAGQWFILLGHINEYHQPLPGSVIIEFCYD